MVFLGTLIRSKKIPTIVVTFARVDAKVVNGIKAQISGHISIKYAANGLKIRTMSSADHQSLARYLIGRGTEFHTFNPNPAQMVKFIPRVLPPTTEFEEILTGLREKGVVVSYVHLIRRNIV